MDVLATSFRYIAIRGTLDTSASTKYIEIINTFILY